MTLQALHHVRAMRGQSHSHLMYCEGGEAYIVKFQFSPQRSRALACDFLATKLADWAGLPVPACQPVIVAQFLIDNTTELAPLNRKRSSNEGNVHFGSRLIGGLSGGLSLIDMLPEGHLFQARGIEAFGGMLALDKWCSNTKSRQAIFSRMRTSTEYQVHFIDQGGCFGGSLSSFIAQRDQGLFWQRVVYRQISDWDSFEPVLSRITSIAPEVIVAMARALPADWYQNQWDEMESLIEVLLHRRSRIHQLIAELRDGESSIFPNWQRRSSIRFSSRQSVLALPQQAGTAKV